MNRIDQLFAGGRRNVLTIYLTAGYPTLHDTVPLLETLQANGADMIEIGMPFSDPMADGPVIQATSARALANGMRMGLLFEQLRSVRRTVQVPLVLMGYVNPVLRFGTERFAEEAAACGIDGVLLPDLPEGGPGDAITEPFTARGIHVVRMVAPRTPDVRIRELAERTGGFLYLVSMAAVTGGTPAGDRSAVYQRVAELQLPVPVLAGFGIHDRDSLQAAYRHGLGGIIGSAFLRALADHEDPRIAATTFMKSLLPTP